MIINQYLFAQASTLWNNLIAYYTGDNTPNDALGAYNGTLINGATYTTGKINNGFSFDGTNDYINFSPSLGTLLTAPANSHSYSAWINWTGGSGAGATIVQNGAFGSSGTIFCMYIGNQVAVYYRGGNSIYTSGVTVTSATWTHIVMTYNGSVFKTYKNGVLSATSGSISWVDGAGTSTTRMGSFNTTDGFFKGIIDEVGVWDREITASEVTELYNSGSGKQYIP